MQAGGGATIVTSVSPVTPIQQVAPSFGEQGGFPGTTDLSGIDGSTQQRQRFAIDAPPSTYWQQPAGPPPSHPERQSAFHGVSAPDFSSGQVGLPNLSSDGRGMAPYNVPDSLLGSNFPSLPSGGRGLAPTNAAVRGEMGATDSLLVGNRANQPSNDGWTAPTNEAVHRGVNPGPSGRRNPETSNAYAPATSQSPGLGFSPLNSSAAPDRVARDLGISHQPFSDSGAQLTLEPAGDAPPANHFDPITFLQPKREVHGEMVLNDPRVSTENVKEVVESFVMALTDKESVKGVINNHQGLQLMKGFHQDHNGINEVLLPLVQQGAISSEVGRQLSQDLLSSFFQHAAQAFNGFAVPIVIEAARINMISTLPKLMTQAKDVFKGLQLHVDANHAGAGFDHINLLVELNNLCHGLEVYECKKVQTVRSISSMATRDIRAGNFSGVNVADFSYGMDIDSSQLDSSNDEVKRLVAVMKTMLQSCVDTSCRYVQRTAPKRDLAVMKDLKIPGGMKGDPNAKIARDFSDNFFEYMMQDVDTFWPLIFIHGVLFKLVLKKGMLVIPPSDRPEVFGQTLTVPGHFLEKYMEANRKLYTYCLSKMEEYCRIARAGRKFDFGEGVSVFIIADEKDGMSVIWMYLLHHAQHTTVIRLQLRDRLQHCHGLFAGGSLKAAVDKVRVDIDLASSFTLRVEPHAVLSVLLKSLANRDPIFLEMLREYERTEGTMTAELGVQIIDRYMTKIEMTARDFNIYEKPIRQASLATSKMDQAQANAFYSVNPAPAPAPGPAPVSAPAPAPKKSPTAAVSEAPEVLGNLTCNNKLCDKKVAKEQCDKFAIVQKRRPEYSAPVCWQCWKVMISGEGKMDINLKKPAGATLTFAKVTAGFHRKKGTGQAALLLEVIEKQEQLYEEAKANPESEKLEQLRQISRMIGKEKEAVSYVSQTDESIEISEEQGMWDLYSEGMSYPSG